MKSIISRVLLSRNCLYTLKMHLKTNLCILFNLRIYFLHEKLFLYSELFVAEEFIWKSKEKSVKETFFFNKNLQGGKKKKKKETPLFFSMQIIVQK